MRIIHIVTVSLQSSLELAVRTKMGEWFHSFCGRGTKSLCLSLAFKVGPGAHSDAI